MGRRKSKLFFEWFAERKHICKSTMKCGFRKRAYVAVIVYFSSLFANVLMRCNSCCLFEEPEEIIQTSLEACRTTDSHINIRCKWFIDERLSFLNFFKQLFFLAVATDGIDCSCLEHRHLVPDHIILPGNKKLYPQSICIQMIEVNFLTNACNASS